MSIDRLSYSQLMAETYKIDRKSASRLLKMSIRTVDRYIRAKKLSIEERDGRIWLNRGQINKLRSLSTSRQGVDRADSEMSIDKRVSTPVDMSIDNDHSASTPDESISAHQRIITGGDIYKKLFEELQAELKLKQERLEGANYRVGQLEGLLKESISLPDHNRLLIAERAEKQKIESQCASLTQQSTHLAERLKDEKFTKKVFLIFLFIIMLLQPLWLIISLQK